MIRVGDASQWIDLIGTLVPEILELVTTTWQSIPQPGPDTHEDAISESLCRALQRNPQRNSLPFQIRPQVVELDPAAGQDQGRMDIVFLLLVRREDIYFCLECKRLNVAKGGYLRAYATEYVRFGMLRFIKGLYAPTVCDGGMLAYVMDGDVKQAIKKVGHAIKKHATELGMTEPAAMLASRIRSLDANARQTDHIREHTRTAFQIHHLFVAVPQALPFVRSLS